MTIIHTYKIKKKIKGDKKHFTEEESQMAYQQMKRALTPLLIWEMQI